MAGNKDIKSVTFPGLMLCRVLDVHTMTLSLEHTDGDANQAPMEPEAFGKLVKDQRLNSPIRHSPKLIFF